MKLTTLFGFSELANVGWGYDMRPQGTFARDIRRHDRNLQVQDAFAAQRRVVSRALIQQARVQNFVALHNQQVFEANRQHLHHQKLMHQKIQIQNNRNFLKLHHQAQNYPLKCRNAFLDQRGPYDDRTVKETWAVIHRAEEALQKSITKTGLQNKIVPSSGTKKILKKPVNANANAQGKKTDQVNLHEKLKLQDKKDWKNSKADLSMKLSSSSNSSGCSNGGNPMLMQNEKKNMQNGKNNITKEKRFLAYREKKLREKKLREIKGEEIKKKKPQFALPQKVQKKNIYGITRFHKDGTQMSPDEIELEQQFKKLKLSERKKISYNWFVTGRRNDKYSTFLDFFAEWRRQRH